VTFLLDTMVVSEGFKSPRRRDPTVAAWLAGADDGAMFVASVTIGEIRRGIELKRRKDEVAAGSMEAWLTQVVDRFSGRVIAIDVPVAQRWGRIAALPGPPTIDAYVAAAALEHDLTVVTRNVRDFERFGVPVLNPYEAHP